MVSNILIRIFLLLGLYFDNINLYFVDMHSRNVLHLDLKTDNVLILINNLLTRTGRSNQSHSYKYVPKISDFGLSCFSV
jgi:serine/threonine protein kinase